MRLHRFYVPESIGPRTELSIRSAELVNQIHRVFRLKAGDSVVLFDGSGSDYECVIDGFGDESKIHSESIIRLHVAATKRSPFMPARDIYLCAAIVKKDTFEWIVEKATELGVTHIIPVMAERSEKKSLNEKRLQKIAVEASEQSGRGTIPKIDTIMTLKEAIECLDGKRKMEDGKEELELLAFHTDAEAFKKDSVSESAPLGVFIGPEGGWSLDEIDMFHKDKISVACLGNQILRAETAVIAALSQVVFHN